MPHPQADRNLLFGILALQMDFITRDALVAAMNAWVLNKSAMLGELLVAQGALPAERRTLLDALVAEHLKQHGNRVERSLAAISSLGSVEEELRNIADPDVQASLVGLAHQVTEQARSTLPLDTARSNAKKGERFQVLRPHAGGGLGEVFVARDTELNREVALKQIRPKHADNPESRTRFVLEAEVTGGLEHPGIVPVYGLGTYDDGRPYYAMRFIRGDSLQDCIRRFHEADRNPARDPGERTLALRELLGRFVDVCNAMEYAHSRGVLHRDLKPGNIMIGKYGETLVVDWGLAKPLNEPDTGATVGEGKLRPLSATGTVETQIGRAVGTPAYMSPEQAAGKVNLLGPASDVYSLGATLYALLTGKAPFEGSDVGTTLQRVQRGDYPRPRSVNEKTPKPLEAICVRAMAVDSRERYASPRALADDIEHWLADEPVDAYRDSLSERLGRWTRRHRALAQASVVTLAVISVVSVVAGVAINSAREAETVAHLQAERSFRDARAAVDEFFTKVSEEKLLDVPGLQPLRRELLESAERYYKKFLKERSGDTQLRLELAAAHYRVGRIEDEIGTNQTALASFDHALAMQSEEAQTPNADPSVMEELANTHNAIGEVQLESGRMEAARKAFETARRIRGELVRKVDGDGRLRRKLANSINNIAAVKARTGQIDEAVKDFERALAERADLAEDFPKESLYQNDLAEGYYNLAAFHMQHEAPAAAKEALEKTLAAYDRLLQLQPTNPDFMRGQALAWREMGRAELAQDAHEAGAKALENAHGILDRLAMQNPFVIEYQADNAAVLMDLAGAELDEPERAIERLTNARTILQRLADLDPDDARYAGDLLACLTNLGMNQLHAGKPDDAQSTLQAALARHETQLAENGALQDDLDLKLREADLRYAVGLARAQKGDLVDALTFYEQARQLRQTLVDASPRDAARLSSLARLLDELAIVHSRLMHNEQALAACREATALFETAHETGKNGASRTNLSQHLRQLAVFEREFGSPELALAALVERRSLAAQKRDELYETAVEMCRTADWVGDEEEALSPDELALRERCLEEGLATVKAAVAAGFDRQAAGQDEQLGLLRDEPEFKDWLSAQ